LTISSRSPCVGGDGALVAAVGKEMGKPREAPPDPADKQGEAVAVLDVGGMDHERERQAKRVGQQMALAAVDLLGRIEPPWAAGFGGLDALAVDDAGARLRPRGRPARAPPWSAPARSGATPRPARSDESRRRPVLFGGKSLGSRRHRQPVRKKVEIAFRTSRSTVVRGRPPCLAAGGSGSGALRSA
jgi:hypothetical protein